MNAPDAITDGGGKKQAALRPIHGVEKVLRLLLGDELDTIATMRVDGGRVTGLYLVRNPDKLGRVDAEVALTR